MLARGCEELDLEESAALWLIGLGLVTWGVTRSVTQAFRIYEQMSLKSDLRISLKHYQK